MKNIKNFNDFLLEYITNNQGANLASKDPIANKEITFDGGDGPSAGGIDLTNTKKEKKLKLKRGNTAKQDQTIKDRERKKKSKEEKEKYKGVNLTHSDQNLEQPNKVGARGGGADYSLQGF